MAQIKFTADITAAAFPLLYEWASRTVLQPQLPEGQPTIHTPQILYCHDVLPTQQGYKSISYKDLVAAASPANITFVQMFTAADAAQNKCLIGVASDSKIYMLTAAAPTWVNVSPAGWAGGDGVSIGNANGTYYLYLANKGCYAIVITTPGLTLTALTGITAANIIGMSSSMNYLILWNAAGAVYWSSTTNPLDFVPSLITGAGSTTPYDLKGEIVVIVPMGSGFVIYTTSNIILSSFSNNTQFPWIFRAAVNGSGISHYKQVSYSSELEFHVALTFAGVRRVTSQGCEALAPEITDFLAANVYEYFNTATNTLLKTDLNSALITRINVLGARYIVLSYGITEFTDILVYDMTLQRWGRLHTTHTCVFEIGVNMEGVIAPYNEASEIGHSYASASPQTYGSSAVSLNNAPVVGHIFGLLRAGGTVSLAHTDYSSVTDSAVLLLGKYQATRNYLLELQEIAVESITALNTGFTLLNLPSLNGKDLNMPITPVLTETGADVRVYKCRSIGKNHTLGFKGSFNLTAVEITCTLSSRR
jgi:hypothetical protein